MSDKITELTGETASAITEAWVASYPNQVDSARNLETLRFHLFTNSMTHWYQGATDDSYFFITNVVPGHQAMVGFISKQGAPALRDWRRIVELMRTIMDEHQLIKLNWMVPGHARRLYDAVKKIKFDLEGWLKSGCLINGKPTDLAALGLFRDDIALHLGETKKVDAPSKVYSRPYPRNRRKKYGHLKTPQAKST